MATDRKPEWWVEPIRWAALAVFAGVPVFALLVPSLAGRIVWTVIIAALPLFIVLVGYHRWRRICPLAFVSQIPVLLRRPGRRRASARLQASAYGVSFAVFIVSLWIRLVATNGSGRAIAVFFAGIALAALLVGVAYTGKTWCNYFCPLFFIEKVYTEPHGLRETANSQCAKCTACKPACPDINEENGYWKETGSAWKRFAYYAYPGLIFGFYFYYYVQAGTWNYYFGGTWTREPRVMETAFLPGAPGPTAGFFFWPALPRAAAAGLTLAACALLSYALFAALEPAVDRWARRREPEAGPRRGRHVLFSATAFLSFVTFYTFAGQPTLRLVPWAPQIAGVIVVLVASLSLARRFGRTREAFAEETVARSLLKRWEWTDVRPPKALHDAFLIHTMRSRERESGYARLLEIYSDALRESLASGMVTREEVHHLEALRSRLQIRPADHERVMAVLAEEERARLSDPARQVSIEKQLQLRTYARAVERHLGRVLDADTPEAGEAMERLQAEHGVTLEEHAAILDQVLGGAGAVAARLAGELAVVERASRTIATLLGGAEPGPALALLADLTRRRRSRAADRLLGALSAPPAESDRRAIRAGLTSDDPAARGDAVDALCARAPASIAERLRAAGAELAREEPAALTDVLRGLTAAPDPYARAAALYALAARGEADPPTCERLSRDDQEIVRVTALHASRAAATSAGDGAGRFGIDRILSLRAVPIFSRLAVEGLERLARSSAEATFRPDEILCREGEDGDEVFVLLEGEAEIQRGSGPAAERLGTEGAGGVIGEMAVLDPAPRAATVRAGARGAKVLRLSGPAFRDALGADPSVADGVIRALARRLRRPEPRRTGPQGQ